jgi:hypothetical protein
LHQLSALQHEQEKQVAARVEREAPVKTVKMKLSVVAFALKIIEYTAKYGGYPREANIEHATAARSLINRGFAEELQERLLAATPALITAFGPVSSKRHQDLLFVTMTADYEYLSAGIFPPVKFNIGDDGEWQLAEEVYQQPRW